MLPRGYGDAYRCLGRINPRDGAVDSRRNRVSKIRRRELCGCTDARAPSPDRTRRVFRRSEDRLLKCWPEDAFVEVIRGQYSLGDDPSVSLPLFAFC